MITASALTKKFNDFVALDHLDLQVDAGEVFCLLGQNGAGKTTTVNIFLGFTEATSGTASIDGIPVKPGGMDTRKRLAFIPEVVMLYPHLTSMENLDFFSRMAGYRYSQRQLGNLLQDAGLEPAAFHRRVGSHSKGMRQKVGIAIAVAKNASAIFMDEPTSGLDPKATLEFSHIVRKLAGDGKAIFMATHDILNAVSIGTRIGIMKTGQLAHIMPNEGLQPAVLQQIYMDIV